MAEKMLKVTQVRSDLGHVARNRGTIRALGLDRIGHSNILPDTSAVRGMIRQVEFLVEVADATPAEIESASKALAARSARKAKVAK